MNHVSMGEVLLPAAVGAVHERDHVGRGGVLSEGRHPLLLQLAAPVVLHVPSKRWSRSKIYYVCVCFMIEINGRERENSRN